MSLADIEMRIEAKTGGLPLADVAVFEIISVLNNPDSTYEQIIEKLSPDIAAKFLKTANSVYYQREVRSIYYAVKLLGFKTMKQLLITSILVDHFKKQLDYKDFNFNKFQKQARFCAAVSGILGEILDYSRPEDLFTVAILHNIGKIIIVICLEEEHRKIIALKKLGGIPTREAEQRILGVNHAEIGAHVLKKFNIPKDIYNAVKYHDATDRIIPEGSNYQLELITRESVMIVDNFILPEEMGQQEIRDRLKETIGEGQTKCRELLRTEMRSKGYRGYREIFPDLLQKASKLVYRDLKGLIERVPMKDDEDRPDSEQIDTSQAFFLW